MEAIVCDRCDSVIKSLRSTDITRVMIKIPRKFMNQHDGEYENRVSYTFELCDDCARKLYKEISGKDPDEVIF